MKLGIAFNIRQDQNDGHSKCGNKAILLAEEKREICVVQVALRMKLKRHSKYYVYAII